VNERQLSLFLRHAFSLVNAENAALKGANPAFVRSMQGVKRIVENLPEGSLRLKKTWQDLEPAVLQALRPYNDAFRDSLFDKLPELTADIEDEVIDMLSAVNVPNPIGTAGQVAGAPTDAPFGLNRQLADTSRQALARTSINNVNLAKLFELSPTNKGPVSMWMRENYRSIDRVVQTGILQGASTEAIAKEISEEASLGGLLKTTKGTAAGSIKAQANTIARTAVQSFNTQVTQRVWAAQDDEVFEGLVYEWTAALDARVCPTCGPLDGRKEDERRDLPPVPIHPNCRCQVVLSDPDDDDDVRTGIQLSREKPTGPGAYASKVKVDGKSFYRKAVEIKKPGATYADYLADLATKDTKNSRLTLAEYFGGAGKAGQGESTLGVARADWFRKAVTEKNVRPDKALQALVTKPDIETKLRSFKAPPKDFPSGGSSPPKPKSPKPTPPPKPAPKPKAVAKPAPPKQTKDAQYIVEHQLSNGKAKITAAEVETGFAEIAKGDSQSAKNFSQMMQFQTKNNISTIWSNGREKVPADFNHWKQSDKFLSSQKSAIARGKRTMPASGRDRDMSIISNKYNERLLEDIEDGTFSSRVMSLGKLKSTELGHTANSFGAIVVKQGTHQVPMTTSAVERVRAAVRESVRRSAENRPGPLAGENLFKRTGKTTWKAKEDWVLTYVHEMGHQVHYSAGLPQFRDYLPKDLIKRTAQKNIDGVKALQEVKEQTWKPSQYGNTNELERFAESYVQFVFAPDELKEASPAAYKWVADAIKKGLQ